MIKNAWRTWRTALWELTGTLWELTGTPALREALAG